MFERSDFRVSKKYIGLLKSAGNSMGALRNSISGALGAVSNRSGDAHLCLWSHVRFPLGRFVLERNLDFHFKILRCFWYVVGILTLAHGGFLNKRLTAIYIYIYIYISIQKPCFARQSTDKNLTKRSDGQKGFRASGRAGS